MVWKKRAHRQKPDWTFTWWPYIWEINYWNWLVKRGLTHITTSSILKSPSTLNRNRRYVRICYSRTDHKQHLKPGQDQKDTTRSFIQGDFLLCLYPRSSNKLQLQLFYLKSLGKGCWTVCWGTFCGSILLYVFIEERSLKNISFF